MQYHASHRGGWVPVKALRGTNGPTIMMKETTPKTVILRTIQYYNTEDQGDMATAVRAWLRQAQAAPRGTELKGHRPKR